MKNLKKTLFVAGLALFALGACNKDDDNNTKTELGDKDGILLVTFGSSYEDPQETFKKIGSAAGAKFSGEEIRWGYTSDIILNKLRQGNGEGSLNGKIIDNDTPEEALKMMIKDGYAKFSVQSLHIIPGEEYDELIETTEKIKEEYQGVQIAVGDPLLTSAEDIEAVAKILAGKFSAEIENGPVVFMGHGTPHKSDAKYGEIQNALQKINSNFFVGTVEGTGFEAGETSIDGIINKLSALSPKPTSVTISPLMSIAGDHANNDMNGVTGETDPAEQSWKERLEAEGYTVNSVMNGLGDYDEINAIWMQHLESVKIN